MKFQTKLALAAALALAAVQPALADYSNKTIRLSFGLGSDHPVGRGTDAMGACLDQKTGGKLKLQPVWGGALGGDLQAVQSLRSGTLEMVVASTSVLVGMVPQLGVFDLPFVINDEKEADALLDGKFGQKMTDLMPAAGLVNLAYWENGFRNLTNSKQPVTKWEDLQGMNVRVMQNNEFIDTFANFGANATPMSANELLTALETHAMDAQENPFVAIWTGRFYEVQKYVTVTNHAYTPYMLLYSKQLWDQLTADDQAALNECAIVGRDAERTANRAMNGEALQKIKDAGLQVIYLSPEEHQRMVDKAQVIWDKYTDVIGKDVIADLRSTLSDIRAGQ